MLRLLSWTGCDKANSPDMRMFVSSQEPQAVRTMTPSAAPKRKLSFDDNAPATVKRSRVLDKTHSPSPSADSASPASSFTKSTAPSSQTEPHFLPTPPDAKMDELDFLTASEAASSRRESVRQVINSQISLEILLKHNELRLIDQEIAKCQVALEQLRRCSEIPYPATQLSQAVSAGAGPAMRSSVRKPLPRSPAPWGVTDGPYTRHYAQWLLPDHRFDGGEPEPMSTRAMTGKSPMKSRLSTRGSFAEVTPTTSSSSRSQRSGNLKSLPAGYGQPKEKATGPMIVLRKSDEKMVKLVCPDCGRHDFGSAQGFINHCRIGHGRSFASHDAAADACGEPVEYDESGAMVGVEPAVTPTAGNVHPLIRSAKLLQPVLPQVLKSSTSTTATPKPKVSDDFRESNLTPHLSALVKAQGLGLNLADLVTDAKVKVEFPEPESDDDVMDVDTPVQETVAGRHPHVAGTKQISKPAKSPASSPLLNSVVRPAPAQEFQHYNGTTGSFVQHPRSIELPLTNNRTAQFPPSDPSPTTESNQAPSLVDDDEEFEAHSPLSSTVSDENDVGEIDFDIQEDDDDARSALPTVEFQPSCANPSRPPKPKHIRRQSAIRRQGEDREEKHVSFVSPSPATESGKPGGEKKRRKSDKSGK